MDKTSGLFNGHILIRNIFWNFWGHGLPIVVAVFAIPLLISGLGTARFGVLTIAWMVIGYFSLFDLGIGRALTKLVSEKIGTGEREEIPDIVWTAMLMMAVLGVLGAIIMAGLAPWMVGGMLEIPEQLRQETLVSFYLLALSIPIVISTAGLRGVLEAYQRFGVITLIRLPLGLATFLGPLAVLPFSSSLEDIVLVLVCARVISWFAYIFVCIKLYPELQKKRWIHQKIVKKLLAFGSWMTVSNVTGPLLLYLGRIFIISMISAKAVAYFVTPYEVVIKLLIIPSTVVSVLFPAFTHHFQKETDNVAVLYKKAVFYIFLVMLPIVSFICLFAQDGLEWWINEEFSQNGYRVAQLLAVGVFINSFGHISQALIQSYGRPDITAKLHLVELVVYIPYLWFLIDLHGIIGAAIAWTVRVAISTLVLTYLASKCINGRISTKG